MRLGLRREISKEIFDRCTKNGDTYYLSKEDYSKVFTQSELYGYGIYLEHCIEKDGKYYVVYNMGNSCD